MPSPRTEAPIRGHWLTLTVVAVMLPTKSSAMRSSGTVNSRVSISVIGDHDRPEWLIRVNGIRSSNPMRHPVEPVFARSPKCLTRHAPVTGRWPQSHLTLPPTCPRSLVKSCFRMPLLATDYEGC